MINIIKEEIKDIINNLKNQPLSKNNILLSNKNKDLILDYIEEVNKLNNDFKDITNYSLSVDKIKELKEKIEYWKEKFEKIVNYISYKVQGLFGDKDKETYEEVTNDLYMNDIIDKKEYNKINGEKEKDDFYR